MSNDICVSCSKTIKTCHKVIFCKYCKLYVHKKCTKLKPREIKRLTPGEWECNKCSISMNDINVTQQDIDSLNDGVITTDVDFKKYDDMSFDPLRYESIT